MADRSRVAVCRRSRTTAAFSAPFTRSQSQCRLRVLGELDAGVNVGEAERAADRGEFDRCVQPFRFAYPEHFVITAGIKVDFRLRLLDDEQVLQRLELEIVVGL